MRAQAHSQDTTEHGATSPSPSSAARPRPHRPSCRAASPTRRQLPFASADPTRRAAPRRFVPGGSSERWGLYFRDHWSTLSVLIRNRAAWRRFLISAGCLLGGSITRVARTILGGSDLVLNSICIFSTPQALDLAFVSVQRAPKNSLDLVPQVM